jgi:glycosyltransferase involved in cell wall biosynthesis
MNEPCLIVIPCYNEASRFPLEAFIAYAEAHPETGFVLVDDGSRDRTIDVLRRAAERRPGQVRVLDLAVNGGKAEAVRMGMLMAFDSPGCLQAGFWDADMATPLETIGEMRAVLDGNARLAMVFGARVKLLGRRIERRPIRHYLGRVFATTVSLALRLPIYDTQCGAKLFRANPEARELFVGRFGSRWVFDVEILARFIQRRSYDYRSVEGAIHEYPLLEWRDVAGSRVRPKDFFRAFWDVVKIYLRYRQR